jgi:hypothetical protein
LQVLLDSLVASLDKTLGLWMPRLAVDDGKLTTGPVLAHFQDDGGSELFSIVSVQNAWRTKNSPDVLETPGNNYRFL